MINQPYDWPLDQLESYRPGLTRPKDFWAFWDKSRRLLRDKPLHSVAIPADYPSDAIVLNYVEMEGFQGATVSGWFARPKNAGKVPGLVVYHGYNFNFEGGVHNIVNWALHGYAALGMLVRGQSTAEAAASPHGHSTGWMTQGILVPEQYYYRGVYMDAIRAIEWLAGQEDVDRNAIGVTGVSQGGGLSLVAAALSEVPLAAVVAEYPYLCHFRRAVDVAPEGPYGEINEFLRRNGRPEIENQLFTTLSYFDAMNFTPDIHCPVEVAVGLVDTITPPSTIFAAYNHIPEGDKAIFVYRYFGHEPMPLFQTEKLSFLRSRLMMRSTR